MPDTPKKPITGSVSEGLVPPTLPKHKTTAGALPPTPPKNQIPPTPKPPQKREK
jgi:hypothetical protein